MKFPFHGQVDRGVFKLNRPEIYKAYCKGLREGKYYLEIHKAKGPPKTPEQLAYYFVAIIPTIYRQMIADGNDTITIKIGNKIKEVPLTENVIDQMLKQTCAVFDGKIVNKADMSMEQASIFIDRCIRWAARWLSCVIPEPTEAK